LECRFDPRGFGSGVLLVRILLEIFSVCRGLIAFGFFVKRVSIVRRSFFIIVLKEGAAGEEVGVSRQFLGARLFFDCEEFRLVERRYYLVWY